MSWCQVVAPQDVILKTRDDFQKAIEDAKSHRPLDRSRHWMHYINAQVGDSRLVLCQRPSDLEVREVLRLTEILRGTEESKRWNQNVWPLHFIVTGCFPQIHECFATPHSRLRFLKMLCTHWTVNEPLPANVVSYMVRCATQLGHRCSNCYLWRQPRTSHVRRRCRVDPDIISIYFPSIPDMIRLYQIWYI